jgi:clan AA aspartic protease
MIQGQVTDLLEPVVKLTLKGAKRLKEIEAIVDTGFSGYLCLSLRYVSDIAVEYAFTDEFELADGSTVSEDVFLGKVIFGGEEREIFVIFTASEDSLIGAALLADRLLTIDYPGRRVVIDRAI